MKRILVRVGRTALLHMSRGQLHAHQGPFDGAVFRERMAVSSDGTYDLLWFDACDGNRARQPRSPSPGAMSAEKNRPP